MNRIYNYWLESEANLYFQLKIYLPPKELKKKKAIER